MKFFGFSEQYVRTKITGARGWVYRNWAIEHEAMIWGNPVRSTSPGYIAQEIKKLKWQRKSKSKS